MPKILVVDDMATDRIFAGGLLGQQSDWHVDYVSNGSLALDAIRENTPDVVITDMIMPEMDGLELVKAAKEEFPRLPVVIMTSQGSEEVAVQALESGAASYVSKKVLARDLLRTVQRVILSIQEEQSYAKLMSFVSREEVIDLKTDVALISPLVNHLRQACCSFGLCDSSNSVRVATAIDEALCNAFYHGNLEVDSQLKEAEDSSFYDLAHERAAQSPYRERRIHVTAKFSPTQATIHIRDEGNGFDPSSLPDPTDPEYLCRPYGRGVMLMRMFMDDVDFNDRGNEVQLTKRRDMND